MALPKHLQPALTPDELTFLAEHDHIDIVPSFSMSRVRLLRGVYGPFQPPAPATVPLWMALSLKRKRKCRVVAPDWLRTESLKDLIEREKTNSEGFEPLPRRFVETAKVLLDVAPDDLHHPAQLRSLLKDLREVRQAKIRMGLQMQDTIQGGYLNVQGLTPLELTELKPFLVKAMSMMQTLEPKTDDGQGYGASQD